MRIELPFRTITNMQSASCFHCHFADHPLLHVFLNWCGPPTPHDGVLRTWRHAIALRNKWLTISGPNLSRYWKRMRITFARAPSPRPVGLNCAKRNSTQTQQSASDSQHKFKPYFDSPRLCRPLVDENCQHVANVHQIAYTSCERRPTDVGTEEWKCEAPAKYSRLLFCSTCTEIAPRSSDFFR